MELLCPDLPANFHFSLATKPRTLHSGMAFHRFKNARMGAALFVVIRRTTVQEGRVSPGGLIARPIALRDLPKPVRTAYLFPMFAEKRWFDVHSPGGGLA
jgi:hypothetical protein